MGSANISAFNDGETRIRIKENVRNRDVVILQSNCATATCSVNENIMELYLMIRTMKRASAKSITVVIPYFGYARQDRKSESRVPISAADVALLLEVAGATRVVSIDLHCGQIQGFFRHIPVDNLYASSALAPYFASKKLQKTVIVSPDAGGVERAKRFQELLAAYGVDAQLAMIIKQRAEAGVVESMDLIGDVNGSDAIIVDDLCDTGGTLAKAAQLLKDKGAIHVYTAITHPVFSGSALPKIGASPIDEMVITDTIPLKDNPPENMRVISIAPLLAEAIARIQSGESVSALFEKH
jgi:ribose-phosphate pyrophosphokinase